MAPRCDIHWWPKALWRFLTHGYVGNRLAYGLHVVLKCGAKFGNHFLFAMGVDHKALQILAHRSEKAGFLMLHNVDFDFGHDDSLAVN